MNGKQWSSSMPGVRPDPKEPRRQDVPQLGTVIAVTAAGVKVEIDAERGALYGPMPWSLGASNSFATAMTDGNHPRVKDRAVIVFAGAGTTRPVCMAWWR